MKKSLIAFALVVTLFPLGVFAKETIGNYPLEYDTRMEADTNGNGKNDRTSYYQGDTLVWSAYDEDENGKPDLWLRYKGGDTIDLEIHDADGNGEPEKIAEFVQDRREIIYDAEAEFAGGSSFSWKYIALLLLGVGVGAWWFRRSKRTN